MGIKFSNRAISKLSSSITDDATSIAITSGDESKFPTLSVGDWHMATIFDGAGNREVVKVTARTGINMTVVRGQEGTSALAFDAGAGIEARLTAGAVGHIVELVENLISKTGVTHDANVAGGSDVTPSAADAAKMYHRLAGTLTDDIAYLMPQETRLFAVKNGTAGAFDVTVKTTHGSSSGVSVPQGYTQLLLCDGTDIRPISPPIANGSATYMLENIAGDVDISGGLTAASAALAGLLSIVTSGGAGIYIRSEENTDDTQQEVINIYRGDGTGLLFRLLSVCNGLNGVKRLILQMRNPVGPINANITIDSDGKLTLATNGTSGLDAVSFQQLTNAIVSAAPPGQHCWFFGSSVPTGWLECNGAAVSRTTYANLFAQIGTTYGSGNGSTTFNLPDLRGEFVRGWDHGRGVDSGRSLGSAQSDAFKSHAHNVTMGVNQNSASGSNPPNMTNLTNGGTVTTSLAGGSETRPRNIALLPCIRY